jgi:hypothetical protein
MEDRLNTVIVKPAVMAALGALGHNLVNIKDAGQRKSEIERIVTDLGAINWSRGSHWDGICGKVRSNGMFSTAGGVKDSGGASYKALADATSDFFKQVREVAQAAA